MIWFTSDTHWGHHNLVKHGHRDFESGEAMDATLTENWNRYIGPQDIVYHLGDLSLQNELMIKSLLSGLNGREKHLILGNHDKAIAKHPHKYTYPGCFTSVQHYLELKLGSGPLDFLVLSHFAFRVWNKSHYGSIHLHGHSHGNLEPVGRSLDVGVDCKLGKVGETFRPISLDEVRDYMRERVTPSFDHHIWSPNPE